MQLTNKTQIQLVHRSPASSYR